VYGLRVCGADGCFSWEAVSVAGLVICKGVCTFISGNTSIRFYFIKEDVGLRVLKSRIVFKRILRMSPWTW